MISPDCETQTSLADELARAEARRLMKARIDLLPEVYRTVFMLRPIEEMRVEDAALALEIPEATVRSRFFRARSLLCESLAPVMDDALADAFTFDGARCDRIVAGVLARARAEELQREE